MEIKTGGADGDRTRVQTNALLLSSTAIILNNFKKAPVETGAVAKSKRMLAYVKLKAMKMR